MNKYKFLLLFYFSLLIPSLSMKQDISFGYDDNFMRFSALEIDSYHPESYTENDYLGDAKTYDSAIISPSIQFTINNKIFDSYKTNFIFKAKYSEYTSSNKKSYISFLLINTFIIIIFKSVYLQFRCMLSKTELILIHFTYLIRRGDLLPGVRTL